MSLAACGSPNPSAAGTRSPKSRAQSGGCSQAVSPQYVLSCHWLLWGPASMRWVLGAGWHAGFLCVLLSWEGVYSGMCIAASRCGTPMRKSLSAEGAIFTVGNTPGPSYKDSPTLTFIRKPGRLPA